jgi:protein ImuB
VWRTEGSFTAMAIADRMRWQVEGWLQSGVNRPTAGLTRLWLAPDEVVPAGGRQMVFAATGPGAVDAVEAADRAARALARAQGIAGVEAVHVVERRGGRGPGEQVRLVPAAAVDVTEARPAAQPGWVSEPWPGRAPTPSPAVTHALPPGAEVLDADGLPVTVSGRGEASAPPVTVRIGPPPGSGPREGGAAEVQAWAGPWLYDERWWEAGGWRRRARLQVVLADGTAHLLTLEAGQWSVEATYD